LRRALVAIALCAAALLALASSADAYLKLGTRVNGRIIGLKWAQLPIRYFVTNRDVPGVSAAQLQQTVAAAFSTWDSAPDVALSSQFAGFTEAPPLGNDNASVIGFLSRPDLDRVLGSTSFTVDTVSGDVIESDIFFNASFPWSVADAGEGGRYDLQSIALHEIGHLHGLGHSALGETELRAGGRRVLAAESIMFPISFSPGSTNARTLRADDIAGSGDIYGTSAFRTSQGSISGRVTKNGAGVLGAHIVAFSPASGKMVGGFTLSDDGSFVIAGLDPGPQVVRAEPLDDADIESFFEFAASVDVDFKPAFYNRVVVVPRGGTAQNVEIKVSAK